jgi:hypothetical protein
MTDPLMHQFGGVADATGFPNDTPEEQGEPDILDDPPETYPEVGVADHASHCEKWLRESGLDADWKVEVATDRTLQLDFDVPFECSSPQSFYSTLEIFRRMLSPVTDKISITTAEDRAKYPENNPRTASYRKLRSKGGRQHVIIALSWDMPQTERIAWQAAFGSDNKREALSLVYASHGQMAPVLLYSRKEEAALHVPILPVGPRT